MNKTKILFIFLLFLILPSTIYADCTKEEINHFKTIEDDYKITYEYNKETSDYDITFYSPERDKYDYLLYTNNDIFKNCEELNDEEAVCRNFPADDYYIEIVGNTDNCDDVFKEINLNLTRSNNFADDPLCEGIEEFVLCQPDYDKELDYETFVSRVNVYKKTKAKEEEKQKEIEKEKNSIKAIVNRIINHIKENLIMIILLTVLTIMIIVTIILTAKAIRKRRRLE